MTYWPIPSGLCESTVNVHSEEYLNEIQKSIIGHLNPFRLNNSQLQQTRVGEVKIQLLVYYINIVNIVHL